MTAEGLACALSIAKFSMKKPASTGGLVKRIGRVLMLAALFAISFAIVALDVLGALGWVR